MFEELYALASHATLTLIVSTEGKGESMTVSVIPKPKDDGGEAALRQPLCLTATPQELDAGFVAALRDYREARASLQEQVAATREVLEAAKSASVKKASNAVSKATKSEATPAPTAAAATVPPITAESAPAQEQAADLFG